MPEDREMTTAFDITADGNTIGLSVFGQREEPIIMQFTGFYDKNGKEIYEGDILQGVGSYKWLVEWDARGGWILKSQTDTQERTAFIQYNSVTEDQIIGNVWENPELLN